MTNERIGLTIILETFKTKGNRKMPKEKDDVDVKKIQEKAKTILESSKKICKIANEFEAEFGSDAWEKLYKFDKERKT